MLWLRPPTSRAGNRFAHRRLATAGIGGGRRKKPTWWPSKSCCWWPSTLPAAVAVLLAVAVVVPLTLPAAVAVVVPVSPDSQIRVAAVAVVAPCILGPPGPDPEVDGHKKAPRDSRGLRGERTSRRVVTLVLLAVAIAHLPTSPRPTWSSAPATNPRYCTS